MAGAGYKLFNTGDVLTAAQVNTYLNEQTVMVFASSAARTSALSGVLAEGMVSYLQDTNAVEVYNGSAWVGIAADQTPLTTKGDLFGFSTVDARIPIGTNGQVLIADSAQTLGLKWGVDPTTDVVTTAGDLIYGTAADTVARLGIGTANQVLRVNSGATAPEWATASSGGMTAIQTGTLSSTSVVISSIPATYKHLLLTCFGFGTSTGVNGDTPGIRLNGSSSAAYSVIGRRKNNTTAGDRVTDSDTGVELGNSANYSKTALDNHFVFWIFDYAAAANWPMGTFAYSFLGDDSTKNACSGVWSYNDLNAAITSVTIYTVSGQTMNNGTYTLWGVS